MFGNRGVRIAVLGNSFIASIETWFSFHGLDSRMGICFSMDVFLYNSATNSRKWHR